MKRPPPDSSSTEGPASTTGATEGQAATRPYPFCGTRPLVLVHDTRWGCGLLTVGLAAGLALLLFPLGAVAGVPLGVLGLMMVRRHQYERCAKVWACGYKRVLS